MKLPFFGHGITGNSRNIGDSYTGSEHSDEESIQYENPRHHQKYTPFPLFIASFIFVIVATIGMLLFSIHFVSETEDGIVIRFGSPRLVSQSGVCFTIPLIERFHKVDMTVHGMAIGYTVEDDETISSEASMITRDFNFLNVYFYLEYQVSDPIKYFYHSATPELILSNLAQSSIRDTIGSYNVDDVITTSRYEIQDAVVASLRQKLEALDMGITVSRATIQDIEMPTSAVQLAFDNVQTARTNADSEITKANTYRNQQMEKAESDADSMIQEATSNKTERINEANGQVARFNAMYQEYQNAPEVTRLRMFYEAMEEILPDVKVIITNSQGEVVNVFSEPYASSFNNQNTQTTSQSTSNTTKEGQ